ncbi:flagellar export chaperone FlgN [Acutalibacter caecimuris]|uniref:flagellar export chaperone FlgN n=1 Tax=Acutalibacter caecimuris TaxID=3093657 RepID=UPI002AC8F189|nr:flagellar export chaperone FlgN [Acutalibacter sp. M00118]
MEPVYQQYLDHLEELSALLEKMTGTANRKAAAARVGDLVKVDACMKEEQAYSMSLRSMDQRRDKMLKAMGLEGLTLSQLSAHYPAALKAQAAKAAERALTQFESYRSAANAAKTTMELALRDIERMFPAEGAPPAADPAVEPPPRMKTDFRA